MIAHSKISAMIAMAAMAESMLAGNDPYMGNKGRYVKAELTPEQKKKRSKAKAAKHARKKNR